MASEYPLSILFLWHQHQPFYKDPLSNRYELPWVRLHATKDYYDMAAILDEFPKIRLNFNLVPSLLQQLEEYGKGKAEDPFLNVTLKAAKDLSVEDQVFLLNNFFMANWANMVDPYPRYRQLLDSRGRSGRSEDYMRSRNYFKEQDWRDLQVWFNLTWFDPYWRERDDLVKNLFRKGKNFTEEEKQQLIEKQLQICALISSKHRELADRRQIEITASPYYHPILPLLCDTESAKQAMPHMTLPAHRFMHPEDAQVQVQRALSDHEKRFGRRPQGMWPSEGSVSDQAAEVLIQEGLRWIATDEAILSQSVEGAFHRDQIYEPYRLERGGKSLDFFFRDHELSDAIGFVYTSWKASDAVQDLMKRLRDIKQRLDEHDGGRPHVVSIILDGENCWEYYKDDGQPFLKELYASLSEEPGMQTVLGSHYLDSRPPTRNLSRVWSGSWINANFAIWIGHHEDNRAWDLLHQAREFLTQYMNGHPDQTDTPPMKLAWEELYIAEGSDWCWWYGDDHSSANDETFDYLFRKHLTNIYTVLGAKAPENLHVSIKPKRIGASIEAPVDFITPKLDGRITSYYEWNAAGVYQTEAGASGTMHRAQNLIKSVFYGYDLMNLYFRMDLSRPMEDTALEGVNFKIIFLAPEGYELNLVFDDTRQFSLTLNTKSIGSQPIKLTSVSVAKIIEIGLPLDLFPDKPDKFDWVISVHKNGLEQERWPLDSMFSFAYPSPDSFAVSWVP